MVKLTYPTKGEAPTFEYPPERLAATAERSARVTSLVNEAADPAAAWDALTVEPKTLAELERAEGAAHGEVTRWASACSQRARELQPVYAALAKARELIGTEPVPEEWLPRLDELRTQRLTALLEMQAMHGQYLRLSLEYVEARRALRLAAGRPVNDLADDVIGVMWRLVGEIAPWGHGAEAPDVGEFHDARLNVDAAVKRSDDVAVEKGVWRAVMRCVEQRYGRSETWER